MLEGAEATRRPCLPLPRTNCLQHHSATIPTRGRHLYLTHDKKIWKRSRQCCNFFFPAKNAKKINLTTSQEEKKCKSPKTAPFSLTGIRRTISSPVPTVESALFALGKLTTMREVKAAAAAAADQQQQKARIRKRRSLSSVGIVIM